METKQKPNPLKDVLNELRSHVLTPNIANVNARVCFSDWKSKKFFLRDAFAPNLDLCVEIRFDLIPHAELCEIMTDEEIKEASQQFCFLLVSEDADSRVGKDKEKRWYMIEEGIKFSFFPFSLTKDQLFKYLYPNPMKPLEMIGHIALFANYFKCVENENLQKEIRWKLDAAVKAAELKLFQLQLTTHDFHPKEVKPITETIEEKHFFETTAKVIVKELLTEVRARKKSAGENQAYDYLLNAVLTEVIDRFKAINHELTEFEKKLTIAVFAEIGRRTEKRKKIYEK